MARLTRPVSVFNSLMDITYPCSTDGGKAELLQVIPGRMSGGGILLWDASMPQSNHNGITILSPEAKWDGTLEGFKAYRESGGTGNGCWVRPRKGTDLMASWAGVDTDGDWIADEPLMALCQIAHTQRRNIRIDSGAVIRCGFTTPISQQDKHNILSQTSFVLRGLKNFSIYAEQDAEITTDHPVHRERTVFFLDGCDKVTISGLKFNSDFSDYSFEPNSPYEHHINEHWLGVVAEACGTVEVRRCRFNAPQFAVKADCFNRTDGRWNDTVAVKDCFFQYATNYCFLSRKLRHYIFSDNEVRFNGRKWHTYGEACAPTTYTENQIITRNRFIDQIAGQSCITPGSYAKQVLISDNFCQRSNGIFVEIGSASNINILNNVSKSTGERIVHGSDKYAGTTHILLVSGAVDDEPAGGLSNILIQGNNFQGGGYALQEYNTGIPIRRGLDILNNHLVDCIPPACTNQSFKYIRVEGNYIQAPDDYPDMTIGGQHSIIKDNVLIGVRLRARDLGYTVVGLKVIGNTFTANSVASKFPALIDYTDLEDLEAYDNAAGIQASYDSFIVAPDNCNKISFMKVGMVEGFTQTPAVVYGSKLQGQKAGAIVGNSAPGSVHGCAAFVSTSSGGWGFINYVPA